MKKHFKYTPVALAVAALIASPLAFASDNGNGNDYVLTAKADLELNLDLDVTTSYNNVSVDIDKDFKYDENVDIDIVNTINPDAYARAVISGTQSNKLNKVVNKTGHTNNAGVSGDALSNSSGNIGLNVTSGDNNQQSNSAALAVADAEMTFGAADAQAHSSQDGELNTTINLGVTNNAGMAENALQNASGNIGVNISAGNNHQQKNNLSVGVSTGGVALAMVTTDQESDRNFTLNKGKIITLTKTGGFDSTTELNGTYNGISDQVGNLYSDIWANDPGDSPVHPTDIAGPIAHADFDSAAQGAVDRPQTAPDGSVSNGGALSFNEAGDIHLAGTTSGTYSESWDVILPSLNNAGLTGNALAGASGNIGVNVTSGTGNQQVNSLAMGLSTGTGIGGLVGTE